MNAMTVNNTFQQVVPSFPIPTDLDGIVLNVGCAVVEAVMTRNGVACPKMSAKPEMLTVYMYGPDVLESALAGDLTDMHLAYTIIGISSLMGDVSQYVLVRSVKSGTYDICHMSELCWIGDYDAIAY